MYQSTSYSALKCGKSQKLPVSCRSYTDWLPGLWTYFIISLKCQPIIYIISLYANFSALSSGIAPQATPTAPGIVIFWLEPQRWQSTHICSHTHTNAHIQANILAHVQAHIHTRTCSHTQKLEGETGRKGGTAS